MPYRPSELRVQKYNLAVIPDNVRAKFEALKSFMVEQQQAQQKLITDFETKIKAVLDDNGILANQRIAYLNFGRALFRAKGHQGGIALRKIVTAEKAKFVQYGLDPSILDQIAYIVVGVPAY